MGGGAHLRMDLPQPEDGQRLREAVRHRRGLHLRGYDADHGEAVSQCLGLSRQSLELDFSHLLPKRVGHAPRPSSRGEDTSMRLSLSAPRSSRGPERTFLRLLLAPPPSPHLLRAPVPRAPRVRWALPGGKETFCGLPVRTEPQKV